MLYALTTPGYRPVIHQELDVALEALLSESVLCDHLRPVSINPNGPQRLACITLTHWPL